MAESAHPNAFGPRLNMLHILTNPPPKLDEVLPGLLAGTVGMLAGPGGIGKTMFELQLAVALAAGLGPYDDLFGPDWSAVMPYAPQRVVFVAAEETVEVIWNRVHQIVFALNQRNVLPPGMEWSTVLGHLHEHLHIYALGGGRRVELIDESLARTRDVEDLRAIADGARLVILDPLRQFHLEDENNSAAMSGMVSALKWVAQRAKPAILVAHHTNRAAAQYGFSDSADAARGSSALTADVRWQLNMAVPTKELLKRHGVAEDQVSNHLVLHHAKGNYVAKAGPVLLRRTAGGVLAPVAAELAPIRRRRLA